MDFIYFIIKSLFVCTHNSLLTYLFAGEGVRVDYPAEPQRSQTQCPGCESDEM